MNGTLKHVISKAKAGDDDAMDHLFCKFAGLIRKLSNTMGYEEAETDLKIAFLELIEKMDMSKFEDRGDGEIVSFINKSLKNKLISILRKHKAIKYDTMPYDDNILNATEDIYENIELDNLLTGLTPMQKAVIKGKFIDGYTDTELTTILKVTRKTIYTIRKKALDILYVRLLDDHLLDDNMDTDDENEDEDKDDDK